MCTSWSFVQYKLWLECSERKIYSTLLTDCVYLRQYFPCLLADFDSKGGIPPEWSDQ